MGWTYYLLVAALFGLCAGDSAIQCDASQHLVADCRFPCPPEQTCQNKDGPIPPCVPPMGPCTEQCVCEVGYARNKWGGYCVTYAQCAKCPGKNEYFACDGSYCEDCTGSCYCNSGYARDANNTCVSTTPPTNPSPPTVVIPPAIVHPSPPVVQPSPPSPAPTTVAPPKIKCDASQHLVADCRGPCPPERTCQNKNGPEPPCFPSMEPCTEQCVCAAGYARNTWKGYCVTYAQCDKCPGYNQYFTCDGPYSQNCTGSCQCADGFIRDASGDCVSKPVACDSATKHEVTSCVYACPPERTCQNRNWPPQSCDPHNFPCTSQCICDEGYARNQPEGVCITFEQCDRCTGEYEYFQCDGENKEGCIGQCYCITGFVRDINGTCNFAYPSPPGIPGPGPTTQVPEIQCDASQNLVADCRGPCNPERTCQNRNGPEPPCVPTMWPCTEQCVCAAGYARNKWGGYCVTDAQCDKCPGYNQYFTCDGPYSQNCTGSCQCADGFIRDASGDCVSKPVACDSATKHEVTSCVYACPPERTCQNRNWPPQSCDPHNFPCTSQCICDEGYARNQPEGVCITFEQCDRCTGEYEYFQCDGENKEDCIGQCYCFSGFVRDINGTCTFAHPASPPGIPGPGPTTQVPEIQCDASQNLVADCRGPCNPERTCQNRNGPEPPCVPTMWPCTEQCVCAAGYARNKLGGYCVTDAQCDKCPGYNQYFTCDGPYSQNCTGSCQCADGFIRDASGDCVSKPVACDSATKHEVTSCVYGCPPERTCQNRNWPPLPCAPPSFPCTSKCICDEGYARNQPEGVCITFEQCDRCTGEYEYFQCDGENKEDCIGQCYCFSGAVRDINGTCNFAYPSPPGIPEPGPTTQVPELSCDNVTRHEVLACRFGCPPERSCQNRHWPPPSCAPPAPWLKCTKKCVCDAGYLRNEPNGLCITAEQCDLCPGDNEYFECDGDYAEDCVGHCYCLSGYVRDIDDKCVYVDPASPPKLPPPPTETPQDELNCQCPCPPERRPVQPVKPVQPVRPVQPVKPVQPVRPVQPVKPVQPVPVEPVQPIQPVEPCEPEHVKEPFEFVVFYNL